MLIPSNDDNTKQFESEYHCTNKMNGSGTPEWLQKDGEGSKTSNSNVVDPVDGSTENDENESSSKSRLSFISGGCVLLTLVSIALFGLFVYAAVVQGNDVDALQWIIFYSFNAALPALFLVYYMCCFPVIAIYILSALVAIWSIVYIVISSLKLKNTSGGDVDEAEDTNGQSQREEVIFELAGASICLFSSLYHSVMAKCCVKKEEKKVEEENVISEDL